MSGRAEVDTPVVVLKLDPNVMHHGTLGLTRSLGRAGVAVHGVHEHRWAPAARSRHLARRWVWRPDPADVEGVLSGLGRIAEHLGRPAVLLATDDAGAILLAEHGDPLRDRYVFPRPPQRLPRRLADKAELPGLCAAHGMPCPHSERADDAAAVRAFAASHGLPLVVKRIDPWAAGATGPDEPARRPSTSLVRTPQELAALAAEVAARPGRLLLQEYLAPLPAGAGPQDWFVHAYLDRDGRMLFGGTGVKERSYPAHAGLTCLGRVEPWPALADAATGFLRRAGYRGIVDLDLRVDARDGVPRLLDANPRLGAQFRLFRDPTGLDLALAAYLDLTGQEVRAGPATPRRFLVEPYDPVAALSYARRGELGLRAWVASLRGVDETAWFARDDPLPFGLMAARTAARALTVGDLARPAGTTRHRRSPSAAPAQPTTPEPVRSSERNPRCTTAPMSP